MVLLGDMGPVYAETNLNQFPVEPWNTGSNLLFLIVALYWALRIKKQTNPVFRKFLLTGLPMLLVGYIGGTVYHATRAHMAWMLMDVVPIYFIGLLTAAYHWRLIRVGFVKMTLAFLFVFLFPLIALWVLFPGSPDTLTISYGILILPVLLPIIIDQVRQRGRFLFTFALTLALISIALTFRSLDATEWVKTNLSMGTHWLWHTFGAATCFSLLVYMERRSRQSN